MRVFGDGCESNDDEREMVPEHRKLALATEEDSGRFRVLACERKNSIFRQSVAPLLIVVLLSAAALGASGWCTIELEVSDGSRARVEGVDVIIEGAGMIGKRTLMTGADGAAVFLGLPAGSFRLEISRPGFQWLEVLDVKCGPETVVRLPVTLERTEGDDVVILPSGPSVDPEATAVVDIRSRQEWELLPRGGLVGPAATGFQPIDAVAFAGTILGGTTGSGGPEPIAVPRQPERGLKGRVSIEAGAGAWAHATGTRGGVSTTDEAWRTRFSFGGFPLDHRLGGFFSLEIDDFDSDNRIEFADAASSSSLNRRRQSNQDAVLAHGVLNWAPTPDKRLDLRMNWGQRRQSGIASSLFLVPDSPLPSGNRNQESREIALQWLALLSDTVFVRIDAGYRDTTDEWTAKNEGLMEQDQSPEGSWSGGVGAGVWMGDGGVADVDQGMDAEGIEMGLEWAAGSGHRLGLEGSWHRLVRGFRYSQPVGGAGLGVRRTYRGPVAERWDTLVSEAENRGVLQSGTILLRDNWRVTEDLTVVLALEVGELQFEPEGGRSGYRFGFDDKVSPRVGLVWDFEGAGRSRVWARWARFRPGPGLPVQSRLTGAMDVETVFVDDDGNQRIRLPGWLAVASDLAPMVVDEAVIGIEYEVLSHLVIGAAAAETRSRNGLAVMTLDGGETFELDTPSGAAWPEGLDNETLESWGWIRKRLANGWQAELLLGWRRSSGTWTNESSIDLADLEREYLADIFSPQALRGARGPLPDDRRWNVAASGSWRFAAGPSLGGRLTYRSGAPVSRLGALDDGLGLDRRFIGGRGSAGRTPELWQLDVIGSWPFEVGSAEVEVFIDVSNLLNSQRAVSFDERWTVLDETRSSAVDADNQPTENTWGEPLEKQHPLELRLGLVYRW